MRLNSFACFDLTISVQNRYCNSAHPHQLKGLYPLGTTCSNPTGATYTASYDAWGNVTSRTYGGTTATLTYDVLDHLVAWNAGSTNQEWYGYDGSGNRVLRRSTTGSGTSITTYAFGLEEHLYGATGINTGNTYYYHLGGRIIGELTGITTFTTQFFLTDALGSVLATFSAIAGSAAVQGNQIYGPYGNQRYSKGPMGTAKGYTGQYADATGLDYYNARYYDPVVGLFVSADTVQGNEQGMDPYAYVGENPETYTDPTGQYRGTQTGVGNGSQPCAYPGSCGTVSAGTGGGTATPIATPRPTPTATPRPTLTPVQHNSNSNGCNGKCQAQKHASALAKKAADQFQTLANVLGSLAVGLGLIDASLFAGSFWAPVLLPWAIELASLIAVLGVMSYKVSEISHLFSEEAANDLSWFTRANLDSKKNQMLLTLVSLTTPSLGSEFVLSKIGDIVEQNIRNSPALLKDLTPSLSFKLAGGTFAIADVIGTGFLAKSVIDYTNEQENGLPT